MTATEPLTGYDAFLALKAQHGADTGFAPLWMPGFLMDFQSSVLDFTLRKARGAALLDCGMGKTPISLVWAENIARKTNKPVLILTPLSVANQFLREGDKFGIEIHRSLKLIPGKHIYVANYERLHYYDPADFSGVVCDEASCIKAFDGKRREQVTEFLRTIPYRLMATATAAPNDFIELGTLSEALGVMGQLEMLSRFFRNDDGNNVKQRRPGRWQMHEVQQGIGPKWRFKGHAELPFWRWVCGWARAGRRPSDLGPFSDAQFTLPPLIEREHIVETRTLAPGMLFALPATNRQEELEERRRTITERCEMAATLVQHTGEPFIVWCQLNPEGDLLERLIPDAVQISGADTDEQKEEKYEAFLTGKVRGMISKQKIGGWGLNCQHCAHVVEFASHSFEAHYQGVRRCWRYGQKRRVINDIIATEGGRGAKENMRRKSDNADRMFSNLVLHMNEALRIESGYQFTKQVELPTWLS